MTLGMVDWGGMTGEAWLAGPLLAAFALTIILVLLNVMASALHELVAGVKPLPPAPGSIPNSP